MSLLTRIDTWAQRKIEDGGFTVIFTPNNVAQQLFDAEILRRDEVGRIWLDAVSVETETREMPT